MSPPSLRQMVGVTPLVQRGGALLAAQCALLLIDYQVAYRQGALALPAEPVASENARQLRAWAVLNGIAVLHVQHQAPAGAGHFSPTSPAVEPLAGLAPAAGEICIIKHLPSAFSGTGLADVLQARAIKTVLLAGYMTHNCVDSTARDAFHRGYHVAVVEDASATRDLPGPGGSTLPAASVHAAVLAGLGDRIAEIVDLATVRSLQVLGA